MAHGGRGRHGQSWVLTPFEGPSCLRPDLLNDRRICRPGSSTSCWWSPPLRSAPTPGRTCWSVEISCGKQAQHGANRLSLLHGPLFLGSSCDMPYQAYRPSILHGPLFSVGS